jgi:hypothetical protein
MSLSGSESKHDGIRAIKDDETEIHPCPISPSVEFNWMLKMCDNLLVVQAVHQCQFIDTQR